MDFRQLWESRMVEEIPEGLEDESIVDEIIHELKCISKKDGELARLYNDNKLNHDYFEKRHQIYADLANLLKSKIMSA